MCFPGRFHVDVGDGEPHTQVYVRQADALSAMGEVEPALAALASALDLDPLLRRSKGFQVFHRIINLLHP